MIGVLGGECLMGGRVLGGESVDRSVLRSVKRSVRRRD